MKILAIETTCDETSVAFLKDKVLLSNFVHSQIPLHSAYNGVVPELASRAHLEKMPIVLKKAFAGANITDFSKAKFDAVAFSRGPGLPGSLMVGRIAAETAALLCSAPLIGVNHLEGHLLACEFENGKISKPLQFPLIGLIASGGHTELWYVKGYGDYKVLGRTRDDAAGEAFDKVAKLLKLPYPGGPEVESLAASVKKAEYQFPRPYMNGTWEFSFSGLKTSVSYFLQKLKDKSPTKVQKAQVCKAFQDAVIDTLIHKTVEAAEHFKVENIAIGGGVSANNALRTAFLNLKDYNVRFSEKQYCSDNAAMITLCARYRLMAGKYKNNLRVDPELEQSSWKCAI